MSLSSRVQSNGVEEFLHDLTSVHSFLEQMRNLEGVDWAQVRKGQFSSIMARVGALTCVSAEQGTQLVRTFGSGPWSDDMKCVASEKIGEIVQQNLAGTRKGKRSNQECSAFGAFLTQQDLSVLGSNATRVAKCEVLARRCILIGLTCPSEPAIKAVMASGLAAGLQADTAQDRYTCVLEFKRLKNSLREKMPKPSIHLAKYPHKPEDLPEILYKGAYNNEDPPCGLQTEEEVLRASQSLKVRRSARELRSPGQQLQLALPAGSHGQWQPNNWGPNPFIPQQQFNTMMQMMQQWQTMQQPQPQIPGLKIFSPNRSNDAAAASADAAAASPAAAGSSQQSTAMQACLSDTELQTPSKPHLQQPDILPFQTQLTDDALEDAETVNAARQQHKMNQGVMKKPAIKNVILKKPAENVILKKPAAADGVKGKRPSMPQKGAPTTWYNGSKIHRSDRFRCWRVFIDRSDRVDKKVNWGASMKDSWARALDFSCQEVRDPWQAHQRSYM